MRRADTQRGFTLVELSIVLVIIGLIIGGVLTGQQIIQNARVTKAINDIQAYQAQFQTYAQNYGALPGDDPAATARFTTTAAIANGNGNGLIEGGAFDPALTTGTATADEALLVWAHLRAAGLLKNQLSGNGNTAVQPPNPFNGIYGIQNGAFNGAFTTTVLCLNNVPVAAAEAIDARLDDGASNSGNIIASETTPTGTVAAAYGNVQTYTMCIRM